MQSLLFPLCMVPVEASLLDKRPKLLLTYPSRLKWFRSFGMSTTSFTTALWSLPQLRPCFYKTLSWPLEQLGQQIPGKPKKPSPSVSRISNLEAKHKCEYSSSKLWILTSHDKSPHLHETIHCIWDFGSKLTLALSEEHWLFQVFPAVAHLLRRQQTKALLGRPRYPTQKLLVCFPFSSRSTFRIYFQNCVCAICSRSTFRIQFSKVRNGASVHCSWKEPHHWWNRSWIVFVLLFRF